MPKVTINLDSDDLAKMLFGDDPNSEAAVQVKKATAVNFIHEYLTGLIDEADLRNIKRLIEGESQKFIEEKFGAELKEWYGYFKISNDFQKSIRNHIKTVFEEVAKVEAQKYVEEDIRRLKYKYLNAIEELVNRLLKEANREAVKKEVNRIIGEKIEAGFNDLDPIKIEGFFDEAKEEG